jgi:hypothetical protein
VKKTIFFLLRAFILAAGLALALGPAAQAGYTVLRSVKVPGEGTLNETSSLTVTIQNGTDLSGVTAGPVFSMGPYLKVDYFSNRLGFQALVLSTENSSVGANPKYTGGGNGAGIIQTSNTTLNVPLHWVVFDQPVQGGYTFVGRSNPPEPIDTSKQFFVVDKKESPFPAGYASFTFDILNFFSRLAAAPSADRTTNSGTVYIYLGANFTGTPAGTYKSNTFSLELATVSNGQITEVHQKRTFTITVVCT